MLLFASFTLFLAGLVEFLRSIDVAGPRFTEPRLSKLSCLHVYGTRTRTSVFAFRDAAEVYTASLLDLIGQFCRGHTASYPQLSLHYGLPESASTTWSLRLVVHEHRSLSDTRVIELGSTRKLTYMFPSLSELS